MEAKIAGFRACWAARSQTVDPRFRVIVYSLTGGDDGGDPSRPHLRCIGRLPIPAAI